MLNAFELLCAIGAARDGYIAEAEAIRSGDAPAHPRRLSWQRTMLIAAVIALALLLVGCAVAVLLNLNSLSFRQEEQTDQRTGQTQVWNLVSLQGFVGSDNYKATQEWYECWQSDTSAYDDARTIDDAYSAYQCYSLEGKAKIDEICEKYGLKLLGEGNSACSVQEILYALGIRHLVSTSTVADTQLHGGGFYPGGSFWMLGEITLPQGDGLWPHPIEFRFRYVMKDVFDNTYLNVGDIQDYDQWQYTAPDGTALSLAISQRMGLILLDRENAFISIQVQNPSVEDLQGNARTMSREDLEAFAAVFDYTFTPGPVNQEMTMVLDAAYAYDSTYSFQKNWLPESSEPYPAATAYAQQVKQVLETTGEPERLGYAFLDIDGNGVEELLIGKDGYCTYVFTESEGAVETYADEGTFSWCYPCEGGTLVCVMDLTAKDYYIRTIDGSDITSSHIRYTPATPTEPEQWSKYISWNEYEPITQEAFQSIVDACVRIPVTMQPLTEYPLEETVNRRPRKGSDYSSYEELIRIKLTNQPERWPRWQYAILDLDGNGQEEMLWQEDDRRWLYTIDQGQMTMLVYGQEITLCENGFVETIQSYSGDNKTYCYYRIDGNQAELVDYLRYDADVYPENPWFYSTDASGQDLSLVSVSQEEAQAVRDKYSPMNITMTPIAQSPYAQEYNS